MASNATALWDQPETSKVWATDTGRTLSAEQAADLVDAQRDELAAGQPWWEDSFLSLADLVGTAHLNF